VPELPEVETVRRDLAAEVVGRRVVEARVSGRRTVRRQPAAEVEARLTGRTVTAADRLGKHLVLRLDDGRAAVVHLRMSGQLRLHRAGDPAAPHTHVRLDLDDGRQLRFVDPRTFGEWFVGNDTELASLAPTLSELGVDPLREPIDPAAWRRLVRGRRLALKGLLMRPDLVAGVGNIYSDEIAHRAGLRPTHRTDRISGPQADRVREAMVTIVGEAVAARGSSLADRQYVDLFGRIGSYQDQHRVYAREGEPCLRCGHAVRRVVFQQRSSFFCPNCQK
jgi:formamidopyrimidine-DNA glycosylase